MLTFEIFSLDDNYLDWMITTQLDDNYQEVVIIQWYCSYHPVLSFDVWLHWNRNIYILLPSSHLIIYFECTVAILICDWIWENRPYCRI